MAIKRTSSNSISNAVKLSTGFASAAIPNSPTIGTATATSDVAATVTYTAAVLGATGSTFTATSNPSSITGTGSSPITVTGLTASTSYTFSVTAGNANGTSAASSASNSITTSAPLSSYESIATVTVGSGGASYAEFTSIPSGFKHLQIRYLSKITNSGGQLWARFNSDTSANYSLHFLYGNGTSALSSNEVSASNLYLGYNGFTQDWTAGVMDVLEYNNTNIYKTIRNLFGTENNSAGGIMLTSSSWRNTNAITTIRLLPNSGSFNEYSQFALYGIKGS